MKNNIKSGKYYLKVVQISENIRPVRSAENSVYFLHVRIEWENYLEAEERVENCGPKWKRSEILLLLGCNFPPKLCNPRTLP